MSTFKIHNTLGNKKEVFVPIDKKHIRIYACGPTVYNYAHIGNARMAVVCDLLARFLRKIYPKVTYVSNITDIDDKIINASLETNTPINELTVKYEKIYNENMSELGVLGPDIQPRATDHIKEMIELIDKLVNQNNAYVADNHVLFDDFTGVVLETDEGVSERAMARGMKALGTLGSGNHFLELQTVQSIEEENPHNLFEGQVVCMIHSGSRGLGHQVCTDHVRTLEDKYRNRGGTWHNDDWGFEIQDRQLAAAPIHSKEGQQYLDAMNGAANFAFANRSALTHRLRQTLAAEFEVETKG